MKYELLNFATGIILVLAGIISMFHRDALSGLNWLVFGSMYLVMDYYNPRTDPKTFMDRLLENGRKVFSYVGLIGSIVVLFLV